MAVRGCLTSSRLWVALSLSPKPFFSLCRVRQLTSSVRIPDRDDVSLDSKGSGGAGTRPSHH
eukprot:2195680-Rhodomonas_salina.3